MLGDGSHGTALSYGLTTTPDGRLLLHDMNTETIDYGRAPKAETQYTTVPVDPGPSSVYFLPAFQPGPGAAADLLVLESMSKSGYLLRRTREGGYGNGSRALARTDLTGWYNMAELLPYYLPYDKPGHKPVRVQGVPAQWSFLRNGKLLALVSYALLQGSEYFDHALVEFDVASM